MIHEFAIDPTIFDTYQTFHQFMDQIGFRYGRMISLLPVDWEEMVKSVCSGTEPVKRRSIEDRLIEMKRHKKRFYLSGRLYDTERNWFENAEAQHSAQPFRAIVTSRNPGALSYVLTADHVNNTNDLWNVPDQLLIRRNAEDMAQCLSLFLRYSSRIIFIDTYFDPADSAFYRPLEHFLAQAMNGSRATSVEYHTVPRSSRNDFEKGCRDNLPQRIPRGVQVRFVRWYQRNPGKDFHDRFILTDIGGISFGQGLSEGGAPKVVQLHLLNENLHREFLNDFDYGRRTSRGSTYKYVDDVVIPGEKS